MTEAVITIRSMNAYDETNKDELEFSTEGSYEYEDGVGRITYFESEVTGLSGTRTRMFFSDREIIVDRDGVLTSRMVFEEGKRNTFLYETPYGQATLGVITSKIDRRLSERGGEIEIDYVMDMEHAVVSKNKFKVSVKV